MNSGNAENAITVMQKDLQRLAEQRKVKPFFIKSRGENIDHLVEYINDSSQAIDQLKSMVRILVKTCVVFDVDIPKTLSMSESHTNAMLCLKKDVDNRFIQDQHDQWDSADCFLDVHDPSMMSDPTRFDQMASDDPIITDHLNAIAKMDSEMDQYVMAGIGEMANMANEIMVKLNSVTKGKLNHIIHD